MLPVAVVAFCLLLGTAVDRPDVLLCGTRVLFVGLCGVLPSDAMAEVILTNPRVPGSFPEEALQLNVLAKPGQVALRIKT